jgi:hypothetical protein
MQERFSEKLFLISSKTPKILFTWTSNTALEWSLSLSPQATEVYFFRSEIDQVLNDGLNGYVLYQE